MRLIVLSLLLAGCTHAPATYKATVYHLGEYHALSCVEVAHCQDAGATRLACTMVKE
jgi:multimeric flavodoxin WrbA